MDPQILHCAAASGVAIVVGVYAATRSEHDEVCGPVFALMVAVAIWTAGLAVRSLVTGSTASAAAFDAHYVGSVAIPPLWLLLAARMTRTRLSSRLAFWLAAPSVVAYAAALTNPVHHLYYSVDVPRLGQSLSVAATPASWAFVTWSYLLISTGVFWFLREARDLMRSGQSLRGTGLATATMLPLVAGLSSSLDLLPPDSRLTPLAIAICVAALFGLHWRHRMRETLPSARRNVIEQMIDGVVILDENGRILDANPASAEILQLEGTLRGRSFRRVVLEAAAVEAETYDRAVADVPSGRGPWLHHFRTRDGRFVEANSVQIRGGDGQPQAYYVVLRDQTEKRRMERFLRQGQRLETVAGLSAGVAHEINNPLAFVRSNLNHIQELASVLQDQFGGDDDDKSTEWDELRAAAEECSEGVERIRGIVDRMRRFSRLTAAELSRVDVAHVVADALKMARTQSQVVSLQTRIASGLPWVRASHEHLVQLVLNLVVNACQAVEGVEGGRVEVVVHGGAGEVFVRVRDNGPGISTQVRSRMFDPFFTTKEPGEGTGLGLSIAFGIARDHGGSLTLETPRCGGAEFVVRLPSG